MDQKTADLVIKGLIGMGLLALTGVIASVVTKQPIPSVLGEAVIGVIGGLAGVFHQQGKGQTNITGDQPVTMIEPTKAGEVSAS